MIVNAECGKPLVIGIGGESAVTEVHFDISDWITEYGSGTAELIHRRAGDSVATPVTVTLANGVVVWTITASDTAYQGVGEAQLSYIPTNRTKKSVIFQTVVDSSLTSPAEVPIPMQGWVEQVVAAGAAAENAAEAAAASEEAAADSAEAAETAAASTRDVAAQVDQNTGDITNLKAAVISALSRDAASISSGTDLNDLKTAGNYMVSSRAVAETILHGPDSDIGYRLLILQTTRTDRLYQIALLNRAYSTKLMMRFYDGTWNAWYTFATTDAVTAAIADAIDATLSVSGKAADAGAVGARLKSIDHGMMTDTTLDAGKWTVGTIRSSDGAVLSSANRIRTGYLDSAIRRVSVLTGYVYLIFAWDGSEYKGVWNGTGFQKSLPDSRFSQPTYLADLPAGYSFKVVASRADDANVTTADGSNVLFAVKTDETLTVRGEPADAKKTGDELAQLTDYIMEPQSVDPTAQYAAESDYLAPGGWLRRSYSSQANAFISVPAYVEKIRITTHGYATFAFLKDRPVYNPATQAYEDASAHYSDGHARVHTDAETTFEYPVHEDMRFLYVMLKYTTNNTLTDCRPTILFYYPVEEFPENSLKARIINAGLRNLHEPCKAMTATLPIQNGQVGTQTGRQYYYQGDDINGVLYSAVYRDGFDVFWNYNLETYYSALANPASILYTQNYGTRNISNAHAIMGAVCSTFVAYIAGCETPRNTAQLAAAFERKNERSLQEVEVGDVLLKSGHTAMITQIYTDVRGRITSVDIADQATPITATRNIRIGDLADYLAENGYRIFRNTIAVPRYLEYDGFASDIIFERGNRTYVEAEETEHMWFYIPGEAETVYYRKGTAAFSAAALADVPTDEVNGVTVYDLAACFDGVGLYTLTTDTENEKQCQIKVIDTGTITINDANGTIALADFENCTPAQYQPVGLVANTQPEEDEEDTNSKAGDPPEGYHCNFLYDTQLITGTGPYEVVWEYCGSAKAKNGYKIAVDFDTGFGLKRVFSDDVLPQA